MSIDKLTEEAKELLKELISMESFSTQENKTADAIERFFTQHGVSTIRRGNNIIARNAMFDPNKPSILLNSHHDTVKPNNGWTVDPFTPTIKDDKLIGLGSNDAGGALVSLIATFRYFNSKSELKYNFILAATAEEENSGKGGVVSILDILLPTGGGTEVGIDLAIVGEPTEMRMAISEKGLMVLDCTSKGIAGHAARDVGENAISNALVDIQWFHEFKFPKISETLGPVKMSVTVINGGNLHNVIPDTCKFVVDVRSTDAYTNEEIVGVIKENVKCEVVPRSTRLNASGINSNHLIVQAAAKLGIETFGSATSSDMPLLGVPAIKMGPGKSERSHTPDEFVYLNEIKNGIELYIRLLESLV